MEHDLTYEEVQAPPDLAGVVRCVWHLRAASDGGASSGVQPIVPDGCPELILNLDDPFVQRDGTGKWIRQPRLMLVGQLTGPAWVGPSGATRIVGIRLTPWGAARLLRMPVWELRDGFIPLDQVLPDMDQLADQLHSRAPSEWSAVTFDHLRGMVSTLTMDSLLGARAVALIRETHGRISVRGLARTLHVGERHLERVMRRDVGLPPVVIGRIMRLQGALNSMISESDESLSAVAMRAGYYDQPHFVREFRRLVGCTPSQFQSGDFGLTRHFVTDGAGRE